MGRPVRAIHRQISRQLANSATPPRVGAALPSIIRRPASPLTELIPRCSARSATTPRSARAGHIACPLRRRAFSAIRPITTARTIRVTCRLVSRRLVRPVTAPPTGQAPPSITLPRDSRLLAHTSPYSARSAITPRSVQAGHITCPTRRLACNVTGPISTGRRIRITCSLDSRPHAISATRLPTGWARPSITRQPALLCRARTRRCNAPNATTPPSAHRVLTV